MTHTYRNHHFHLIWSTKLRENMIQKSFQNELYSYIAGIIKLNDGHLVEIGGIANHVHLLVSLDSLNEYSELIRKIKGSSTAWINKEKKIKTRFSWQEGYASFAVSYSLINNVRNYIVNQENHHANQTFEQEYLNFLKINGIHYDERYVFD